MRISNRTFLAVAILAALGGMEKLSAQGRSLVAPMSPVTAKLTIPDSKLLPGVPFDMWIDVSNDSDATVGVGLCADMVVRAENGEPFTVVAPPRHSESVRPDYPVLLPEYDMSGPNVTYLVLRPHQRQTLTLPILPGLTGPAYFHDARLSKPGRYGISLGLDYCWPGFVTLQKSLLPATFLGPVTTNEVTIERITPTGSDTVVWKRMQGLSKGEWAAIAWKDSEAGKIVRTEIRTKYTDSNYLPYVLLVDGQPADALLDAIKRFPDSPVIELLRYTAALAARDGMQSYALRTIAEEKARRPTTRILIFGREDVKRPCPPDYDCSDP